MLRWAQTTVQKSTSPNKPNPPTQSIRSFKDPSISNALFFLDLLDALRPGIVDYTLVLRPANDYDAKRQNGEEFRLPLSAMIIKHSRISPLIDRIFPFVFSFLYIISSSQARHLHRSQDERIDLPGSRGYRRRSASLGE